MLKCNHLKNKKVGEIESNLIYKSALTILKNIFLKQAKTFII